MENIKVYALVLRAVDYLENDKILTLLTAERGRLTAGIKGVKKAGAKLKFAAQPFCLAEYILAERSGRYTVIQASECESYYDLRTDIARYYAACAVCETALALSYEGGEDGDGLFVDCVNALSQMCIGNPSAALIEFFLDVLKKAGYGISLGACPCCGESLEGSEKLRFDMGAGAFTCWDCSNGAGVSGVTYASVLAAVRSAEGATPEGEKRALKLLRAYLGNKTDAECRSLTEYIALI